MRGELPWLVALMLGACGTVPQPTGPADVVDAQAAAVARGDLDAAFALLSPDAQAVAPMWPPRDRVATPVDGVEVRRTARWLGTPEALVVVRTAEGWRLSGGVLGLMRADTPEEAVRSFAVALESRDYAAILQLIPEDERGGWSVERLQQVFEAPEARPRWRAVAETLRGGGLDVAWLDPRRVHVRVEGLTVTLTREPGGWKVFDVTPATDYTP